VCSIVDIIRADLDLSRHNILVLEHVSTSLLDHWKQAPQTKADMDEAMDILMASSLQRC
jgi:hypothetical protein